jgi:RNA polymerase sigma-70 factor (ECF subfamily)
VCHMYHLAIAHSRVQLYLGGVSSAPMTASALTYWFGSPPQAGNGRRAVRNGAAETVLLRDGAGEMPLDVVASPLHEPDGEFVTRIRAGDKDAFDKLFHTYYARLWVYARRRVSSDDDASDVVQDVFVALWHVRERWTVNVSVKAYLFGAVQRRILHVRRHQNVVDRTEAESVAMGTPLAMGNAPVAADTMAEAEERAAAIATAVLALPERQRVALGLWWRDEMTSSEIAHVLDVSPQAVRKLLGKAWDHLRETLPSDSR